MLSWFRSLFDRHHARHVDAVLDFEANLVARQVERKAALLRPANRLDDEGLCDIAAELRACASAITFERPLSSLLLPATIHAEPKSPATSSNGAAPKMPARSATK